MAVKAATKAFLVGLRRLKYKWLILAALAALVWWSLESAQEGWKGLLPVSKKCPPGQAWDARATRCVVVPETASASGPELLPWPSHDITLSTKGREADAAAPFEKMLNLCKSTLKRTHDIESLEDVKKNWGVYHNSISTGGDGLCYILRKTRDVDTKIKAYSQSWLRATVLVANATGRLTSAQEANLKLFMSIPDTYGGICPLIENDLTLASHAGAYTTPVNIGAGKWGSLVFSLYPIKPREIPAGNTIADKRFGIIIHELSHVACMGGGGACSGLDKTNHGGDQTMIDNTLRDISAEIGLKPHNPKR
jgi:hypothetical protein